jgi:uncharacterized membrane protein
VRFNEIISLLLFVAVVAAGAVVAKSAIPALRVLVALPLVFFIPGYAILSCHGKDAASGPGRILYAAGLSLAAVIACGFFLHIFHALSPLPWALLLILVSVLLYRAAPQNRVAPTARPPRPHWRISRAEAVMFAGAAILAIGALAIGRHEALAHSEFKYTEFWMVSQDPGKTNALTIGLKNEEGEPASYDVEYMVGGQIAGRLPPFQLAPAESWTHTINTSIPADRFQRVEAWLFKNGDHHTVYRRVWADLGSPKREGL